MNVKRPLLMCVLFVFSLAGCLAQSFDGMPIYKPMQQVSGTIRIRGDYHQRAMLKDWENGFHAYQPKVVFQNDLTSTVHAIPALVFNLADLGLMGREIAPLENLSFRRMFKYDPLGITTATGSFDTPYQAFALGVFVNKANPLSRLTLKQVAAIFGCGPGRNIRTWGQLGLTGEWANKPIHVFGYPTANNIASFFELKVLDSPASGGPTLPHGVRWNCDLKEYSNTYNKNDRPQISSDAFMMQDLGTDPYAIAYSGIAEQTPQVKALALAANGSTTYIPFTRETVMTRTYPLTRSMYVYLNRAPGRPIDPAVAEFLRFILSRQGEESVMQQNIFLPLTTVAVNKERDKIR